MAREVVIWCEKHFQKDERVVGEETRVHVDGLKRRVDLCAPCREEVVGPLEDFIREFGYTEASRVATAKKVGAKPSPGAKYTPDEDGKFVCADCGRKFDLASALGRHRTVHG